MVALAVLLIASRSWGHDTEIIQCDKNLKVNKVKKIAENVNPNGTLSEAYDRNADGKVDIEAISHSLSIKKDDGSVEIIHAEHPFLYVVDLDYDGEPDAVYVDKSGAGRCEDIVLYKDLTQPHHGNTDQREEGHV